MGWGPIIPNVDFGDFTPPALGVSGDLTGEGDNPKLLLMGVTPYCTVLVSWKLVDFSLVLVIFLDEDNEIMRSTVMIIQVNSFLYQYFMIANNFVMKSDNDDDNH